MTVALLGLAAHAAVGAEAPRPEGVWVTAQVADASDRAYQPLAIHLIDHAQSSIVLAMYYLKEGETDRHPVSLLLNDLREAARRGVKVEVYLNRKFPTEIVEVLDTPWLARLREAGVTVTGLNLSRRWHGKVLIVDERYVLEGSTNWSVEALKSNGESNTLMDSPQMARQKLAHIRTWGVPTPEAPTERPAPPAPEIVAVPAAWLKKGGVMPQLVTRDDERGFDVLLLLLRQAAVEGASSFPVDITRLGQESGVPPTLATALMRLEMLRVLRRLQRRYSILTIKANPTRDAWVALKLPAGPAAEIRGEWTDPDRITRQSSEAGYLAILGEALRQHEQLDVDTLTLEELSARTGLSISVLGRARQELKESGGLLLYNGAGK